MTSLKKDRAGVRFIGCYFARRTGQPDGVSESLLRFKDGKNIDVEGWTNLACEAMSEAKAHFDLVVRNLGSNELKSDGHHPLDRLAERLAEVCEGRFDAGRLSKRRTTKPLKTLNRQARSNELAGTYKFAKNDLPPNLRILIIDDICTTGLSLSEIENTIKRELPKATVRKFVLGRTFNPEEAVNDKTLVGRINRFSKVDTCSVTSMANSAATTRRTDKRDCKPRNQLIPPKTKPTKQVIRPEQPSQKSKGMEIPPAVIIIGVFLVIVFLNMKGCRW